MNLLNIDFDGVLVPNRYEDELIKKARDFFQVSNGCDSIWDWYAKSIYTNPLLPINEVFLRFLSELENVELRLWTNRNSDLKKRTLENLGPFKSLFNSFSFYSGKKKYSKVEGVVIDNNPEYLHCGEFGGLLYKFNKEVI